jgi:hypothetical protein
MVRSVAPPLLVRPPIAIGQEAVMPAAESRGMVGLSVSSDRLPAQPEKPVFRCFICRIGIRFVRELVFMPAGVMHLCCSGPPEPA